MAILRRDDFNGYSVYSYYCKTDEEVKEIKDKVVDLMSLVDDKEIEIFVNLNKTSLHVMVKEKEYEYDPDKRVSTPRIITPRYYSNG